jgi:hypothetical protein
MGLLAVIHKEVPGHNPLGDDAAPFEIAVGAFPVIPQDAEVGCDPHLPAQVNAADRIFRGKRDFKSHACGLNGFDGNAVSHPGLRSGPGEIGAPVALITPDKIRRSNQIKKA